MILGRANGGPNLTFTWDGTSTSTTLAGSSYGNNVFNLAAGGETITAGDASINPSFVNTFNFDKGDGHATVNMNGGIGVLQLASDITASDVLVQADNSGDLTVVLADTGDSITFTHDLNVYYAPAGLVSSALSQVNFGNGASSMILGRANGGPNLSFTWDASATDTTLIGSNYGYNAFNLAAGNDTITAGNQTIAPFTNTFNFDKGDGHATVNMNGGAGVLNLASDITASDVLVQADNSGGLTIMLADTGDSVTFTNDLAQYSWGGAGSALSQIKFSDGSSMAIGRDAYGGGQNLAFTFVGTATNTTLNGSHYGANVFDLGPGNDTVTTGTYAYAGNAIEFDPRVGHAVVNVVGGNGGTNQLDFGAAVSDQTIWFEQTGNDLQMNVLGASSEITISNWYSSTAHQLQEITAGGLALDSQLASLVSAMATYSAAHASFDPTTASQMPSDTALAAAIGSAWHH